MPNKLFFSTCLVTFILLIFPPSLLPVQDPDIVSVTVFQSRDGAHPGSSLKVAVQVKIKAGWHINSNAPLDPILIPTLLKLTSTKSLTLGKVIYPKPLQLELAFSADPVATYQGDILIGASLKIPAGLKPGKQGIQLKLQFQGCDDATCLPPTEVAADVSINVVGPNTAVNSINETIFDKIAFKDSIK